MHERHALIFSSALLASACHAAPSAAVPGPAPELDVAGLDVPESVLHDASDDVYLVSNIGGSPFEQDGNGFVSRIAPDGTVIALRWIDGLDAPKGMAIAGDVLAVADLTVLRRFDRHTGAPRDAITIPGASFLNDVVAAPDGSFFVGDSGMARTDDGFGPSGHDALFRVAPDGAVTTIASGPELALPNGLAIAGDELLVVSFGAAALMRFALDGTPRGRVELPAGQLDGLVALESGCLIASSFGVPGVIAGTTEGAFATVIEAQLAADIGLDARRGRLLLPMIAEGRLRTASIASLGACERAR
ncbi:SMP-30/gluconolactonase/LRE family protein [Sandaracinus amylolyticus]|uniref:SMP-30/gluconolactonase/LRE family protein n=1 Tax=Sandaracinus amylolyticus TaxID=927083 RepID=UPI001F1DF0B6|nr:SMP-30/gluconolactonase/LRE family protein [Sandaracinus amylolyticus]UJR80172.1 SGL domain-containing protein [Sandaracinus amylolyticus]